MLNYKKKYELSEFFLICNIIINCDKLKEMRLLILLMMLLNFFNPENNILYSINKIPISLSSFEQKSAARLVYKDGFLSIEGIYGNANVTIYSIIGNKVAFFSNVDLRKFKESIPLQRETMYIARIEFSNTVFTYKFFTR